MSSIVTPQRSMMSWADLTRIRVANLKTSLPFIFTNRSGPSKIREPLPGSQRLSPPAPSAPSPKPKERREQVAADYERPLRKSADEHPVRLRERVHEAGAAGREVVGRRVDGAEL